MRDEIDAHGRDLVVECEGVFRPIQLKAMALNGKKQEVPVNIRLARVPSACIIWLTYDLLTLEIAGIRWFGGAPGQTLPDLGDRIAKRTRPNSDGVKVERTGHRTLRRSQFTILPDMAALADRLFGDKNSEAALFAHLADRANTVVRGWLADVSRGDSRAIPAGLDVCSAAELAEVIDGYALLGADDFLDHQTQAAFTSGRWPGSASELWITLFLEHRRMRFADGFEPDPVTMHLQNLLVRQLREKLLAISVPVAMRECLCA